MPTLPDTSTRENRLNRCVGVMSGTSLDGIDVAVVDVTGSGCDATIRLVHSATTRYPEALQGILADLVDEAGRSGRADLGLIARLQIRLAHEYAGAVRTALDEVSGPAPVVVGCHGQTVFHAPTTEPLAGIGVRGTIQLGDPSALAELLGMTVVGDFRVADMAAGGEGAPIVPYLDWCILGSDDETRLALNVGGIANVTVLPVGCARDDVTAFDTGPGNCLIDAASRLILDRPIDRDGQVASTGTVNGNLVDAWMRDAYFGRRPPKSTGREYFNAAYAERLMRESKDAGLSDADTLATITDFTATAVAEAVRGFVDAESAPVRMLVSGGGVHNRALMTSLERRLPGIDVESSEAYGLDPDAKEAILCAFLASEALAGVPTGMPSVTGASRPVVLGKICQGGQRSDAPR